MWNYKLRHIYWHMAKRNYKILLLVCLLLSFNKLFGQARSSVTNHRKNIVNTGITPLSPTNTGGAVPAQVYATVTTLAGSGRLGFVWKVQQQVLPTRCFQLPMQGNLYVTIEDNNAIRKNYA